MRTVPSRQSTLAQQPEGRPGASDDDDDDDDDNDDDDDDDCSASTSRLWGKWLLLAHDSSGNSSLSSTNSYNNPKVAEALKTRGAL